MILYIVLGVVAYFIIGVATTAVVSYIQKENRFDDFPVLILLWPLGIIGYSYDVGKHLWSEADKKLCKIGDGVVNIKKKREKAKEEREMKKRTKRLTIMVCGFAGTGKTLVARKIEELLAAEGIPCDRIPDDDEDFGWDEETCKKKLKALLDGGFEIVVKSVQVKRPIEVKTCEEDEDREPEDLDAEVQTKLEETNEIQENSKLYES